MIEITKACTVAFMKERTSFIVERNVSIAKKNKKQKTEEGENLFFKGLANRFWLTSKRCSCFNKVVQGQPSSNGLQEKVMICY